MKKKVLFLIVGIAIFALAIGLNPQSSLAITCNCSGGPGSTACSCSSSIASVSSSCSVTCSSGYYACCSSGGPNCRCIEIGGGGGNSGDFAARRR